MFGIGKCKLQIYQDYNTTVKYICFWDLTKWIFKITTKKNQLFEPDRVKELFNRINENQLQGNKNIKKKSSFAMIFSNVVYKFYFQNWIKQRAVNNQILV